MAVWPVQTLVYGFFGVAVGRTLVDGGGGTGRMVKNS